MTVTSLFEEVTVTASAVAAQNVAHAPSDKCDMSCKAPARCNVVADFLNGGSVTYQDRESIDGAATLGSVIQHELMMGIAPVPAPSRQLTADEQRALDAEVDALVDRVSFMPLHRAPGRIPEPKSGVRLGRQ